MCIRDSAKALLQTAIDDALQQGKDGLVTVVGTKKFHFMSDTKWLLRQGFVAVSYTHLDVYKRQAVVSATVNH